MKRASLTKPAYWVSGHDHGGLAGDAGHRATNSKEAGIVSAVHHFGTACAKLKQMAKGLITTPFPSTAEVARKLGLSDSRIRSVIALMSFSTEDATEGKTPFAVRKRVSAVRKKVSLRSRAKRAKPRRKTTQKS